MAKSYAKGYRNERELVHKLYSMDFLAIRAPRSGRIGLPSPDILAAKLFRQGNRAVSVLLAIECKSHSSAFSVRQEQLEELKKWQSVAGALSLVAWKIPRKGWYFLRVGDVEKNSGNIGKKFAEQFSFGLGELESMALGHLE